MPKKLLAALAAGLAATALTAFANDGSIEEKRGESPTIETQKASPSPSETASDRNAPDAGKDAGK